MNQLQIPLFPLGLVLFPGSTLPLKVFEQRYVEMTKTCVRDNTIFGVCRIRHGQEVGAPAEHEQIGCSARIAHWDMPHPNLFQLICVGEREFRVVDSSINASGLILGHVQWLANDFDGIDAENFSICREALERVAKQVGDRAFAGPAQLDDPEWVSYRLADLLPVDSTQKQSLLEQRSTAQRLTSIVRMLQPD